MDGVSVTRVIPVPVDDVWRVFTDPGHRSGNRDIVDVEPLTRLTPGELRLGQRWRETRTSAFGERISEDLMVVAVAPQRSCTIALAGSSASGHLTYRFRPVTLGGRPATEVMVSTSQHSYSFANRLLGFVVGGFAARTAEGALRSELDALAAACAAPACA